MKTTATTPKTPGAQIAELPARKYLNLFPITPKGTLQAYRFLDDSVALYWRLTFKGNDKRINLGFYDSSAPPRSLTPTAKGMSVEAARVAAEAKAREHQANIEDGGYLALVADREKAKRAAVAESEDAAQYTLRALLLAYCDSLEADGKASHKDARSVFKCHVFDPFPAISDAPAKDLTVEQFSDIMRACLKRTKDKGKVGRTMNKLRSFAARAFVLAKSAKSNPKVPQSFKAFGITVNVPKECEPDPTLNRRDKVSTPLADMRKFWRHVRDMPGFKGALLRLFVLTGGQRHEQLTRLKTVDIGDGMIAIYDKKGRHGIARRHVVPLIPAAAKALAELKPGGEYAISTDGGTTCVHATTLSGWATDVATEIGLTGFLTKRVRKASETLLSAEGVSKEHRERLQSHGISGVTAQSYNDHDFAQEKFDALRVWFDLLEEPDDEDEADTVLGGNVVPIDAKVAGPKVVTAFVPRKRRAASHAPR